MNTIIDHRREVDRLAYTVRSFPRMSAAEALADLAPGLTAAERDEAFGDYVDASVLRDALCKACEIPAEKLATLANYLIENVDVRLASRAANVSFISLLTLTQTHVSIIAAAEMAKADEWTGPAWDALDGRDKSVDGALAKLAGIRDGYWTSTDFPDADPEQLEQLAKEEVVTALEAFEYITEHRIKETALVDVTVACWRFADAARLRLVGGAR